LINDEAEPIQLKKYEIRAIEKSYGKDIPIYEPKSNKFTYKWEQVLPREFKPSDIDIPLSLFNEGSCNFGIVSTVESINKLNQDTNIKVTELSVWREG